MIILESFDVKDKFAGYITAKGTLSFALPNDLSQDVLGKRSCGTYKIVKNTVFALYFKDGNMVFQVDDYAVTLDDSTKILLNRTGNNLFLDNLMDYIGIRHVFRIQRNQFVILTYKYLYSDVLPNPQAVGARKAAPGPGPKGSELTDFFLFAKNMINDADRRNDWFSQFAADSPQLPDLEETT